MADKRKESKESENDQEKSEDENKLLQRVYERRLKGSRRSRRQRSGSTSSKDSKQHRHSSAASIQSQKARGSGPPPLKLFPPRLSFEEERRKRAHANRLQSPQIVVTPPPAGSDQQSPPTDDKPKRASSLRRLSKGHLQPPPPKRRHKSRKGSTVSRAQSEAALRRTESVRHHGHRSDTLASVIKDESQLGDEAVVRLTKSHAALRLRQRHGKYRRGEKWTKEEIDWEWKELLWRMNLFGRVYMSVADIEYRVIRFGYKYEGVIIPTIVIFLMFFLPLTIIWDYLAIIDYEVPQFTFMRRVGCITLIHFIAIAMNTYCYMTVVLTNKRHRLRFLLGLGMFVHPLLFFIRWWFDKTHVGYTTEKSIYYDSYERKVDDDPPNEGYQGHADRFSNDILKFQPWDQFVEDRDRYFHMPLQQE